jgi:hypothetical protein
LNPVKRLMTTSSDNKFVSGQTSVDTSDLVEHRSTMSGPVNSVKRVRIRLNFLLI